MAIGSSKLCARARDMQRRGRGEVGDGEATGIKSRSKRLILVPDCATVRLFATWRKQHTLSIRHAAASATSSLKRADDGNYASQQPEEQHQQRNDQQQHSRSKWLGWSKARCNRQHAAAGRISRNEARRHVIRRVRRILLRSQPLDRPASRGAQTSPAAKPAQLRRRERFVVVVFILLLIESRRGCLSGAFARRRWPLESGRATERRDGRVQPQQRRREGRSGCGRGRDACCTAAGRRSRQGGVRSRKEGRSERGRWLR